MAKRKNILGNRHKKNAEHLARTDAFVRKVQQIFDLFSRKAAKIALSTDYDQEKEFKWADFKSIEARVNTLTSDWAKSLNLEITSGIRAEWDAANNVHDDTLKRFFEAHTYTQQKKKGVRKYFEYNKDAVDNFIERKTKGLSLSENLWNMRGSFKDELEAAIATGIEKGTSAAQLSKQLSQYLNDFQRLKKDYSEKFGKQVDIKNCEYKAARLARTEINMSYREAEQERWRNEDFVVGYEIKRSGTPYPCPVCENLQGKYPKDFKWNGWHPNCRCYAVPILKTEEEFWADEGESTESENEVTELPENFKDWIKDNRERINSADRKSALPYFIEDNSKYISIPSKINAGNKTTIDFLNEFESVAFSNEDDIRKLIEKLDAETDINKRVAIMDDIRTKAAEFTKKELEKAKAVEGLTYVGEDRGVVITEKFVYKDKDGNLVEVPPVIRNVLSFKDEFGKIYRYPVGISEGQITYSASYAAKEVKQLPSGLRDLFDSITFNVVRNPADQYWAQEYNMPYFVSAATSSRNIKFWRRFSDFKDTLLHELGHNYDMAEELVSKGIWEKVCLADEKATKKKWVSDYSSSSRKFSEDFADSFSMFYFNCVADKKYAVLFKERMPNRYDFLSKLTIWGL